MDTKNSNKNVDFSALVSPFKFGPFTLPSRTAVAPMNNMRQQDGYPNMDSLCFYTRRARGGYGLIIAEPVSTGKFQDELNPYLQTRLYTPEHAKAWRLVVEGVHSFGGRIIAQLAGLGAGRQHWDPTGKTRPAAASPIPFEVTKDHLPKNFDKDPNIEMHLKGDMPRELTRAEIYKAIEDYYMSTRMAIMAGFDGVEYHTCHGYSGHNFLSPNQNFRTDEFGGSWENRTRFARESFKQIMRAIRDEGVEGKFVAGCRTSAAEHTPGGFTYEDMVKFHKMLIELGSSFVDLSDSAGYERWDIFIPDEDKMPLKIEQAHYFDKELDVPVLIPSVHDPVLAAQLANETKNIIFSHGRQSLADPDWTNKIRDGKVDEINRCKRCNIGCMLKYGIHAGVQLRCIINPEMGFEMYDSANYPKPMAPGKYLR
ncbi:NADH:flavin oxidoreductase [Cloacibacillus evryensis]|uniref:NADH:flavin oxidoreductase n=1 Tax=Cloacibacillus evryensis TaxID=508460 RepID=UPI002109DCAE|nr:NADH:flavin oxidoreductase [Cloacibacillus evryensis]MCQ4764441.1 NADH:flavin oxidoreductase [Cloacibacillus evryensis]